MSEHPVSVCNELTTTRSSLPPGPVGRADLSVWLYLDAAAVLAGIHSSLVRQATEGQAGNPKGPGWTWVFKEQQSTVPEREKAVTH